MPDWKTEIRRQLAGLKLEAARESEIVEEVWQHLQDRLEELLGQGRTPEEANELLREELGSGALWAEELKRTERSPKHEPVVSGAGDENRWENLWRDLRYGARALRKQPGFTLIAAFTLALGMGANTLMFSVARAVLFRPLGYVEEDRLFWIKRVNTGTGAIDSRLSWQDLEDIRALTHSFESVVTDSSNEMKWEEGATAKIVPVMRATPNLPDLLRLRPALGRLFLPSDSTEPVALVSYELWQSHFGGRTNVLGQTVRIDTEARTIVGVLPAGFEFPIVRVPLAGRGSIVSAGRKSFWTPMLAPLGEDGTSRAARMFLGFGRLKAGLSEAAARAELASLAKRLESEHPESNRNVSFEIAGFRDELLGPVRHGIPMLAAAVLVVLLICCVNLANLLLARGLSRQREMAVRLALGAGRARLVSALLMESGLLALLGGAIGMVMAAGGLGLIRSLAAGSVPFIGEAKIELSTVVFTAGVSMLTALLFGLLPALRLARAEALEALRAGARSTGGPQVRAWQQSLMIGQVAVVLALLAAASLLLESFRRLLGQDLGYQPQSVVTLDLSASDFATNGDMFRMYRTLRDRIAALPGIQAVGTISSAPLTGKWTFDERPDVVGQSVPLAERPSVAATFVAFDYFQAMGIPLRAGRYFRDEELNDDGYGKSVILNEAAARVLFPHRSALGGRFTVGSNPDRVLEVIGVVKDTRDVRLEERPSPRFYWQYAFGGAQVVVRGAMNAEALLPVLRATVLRTDPRLRVDSVRPMTEIIASTVAERRFLVIMTAAYAALALGIAAIGIFGVVGYQAAQRQSEFGIRLALGSSPRQLMQLVLFQSGRLTLAGLAIGLALSLATNRLLASQLYQLSPHEPLPLLIVSGLLLMVSLLASLWPARRAAKVDPMVALRSE